MSIATELITAENSIKSAYTVLQNKGATIPANKNLSNLSSTIDSISSGSAEIKEYLVTVIDYDGTVLKQERLNANEQFTMPEQPSHTNEGLVFDGWSSPVTITNDKLTVVNQDITVGALYHPSSNKTEFDMLLTTATGLTVQINCDGTKDWGDGTIDTTTSHTYPDYGYYTIKLSEDTQSATYNCGTFYQTASSKNKSCIGIRLAKTTSYYQFYYCKNLQFISIPLESSPYYTNNMFVETALKTFTISPNCTDIFQNLLGACYYLEYVAIPSSLVNIYSSAFDSCWNLKSISTYNVTNLGAGVFSRCCSLEKITLNPSITTLQNALFNECYKLKKIEYLTDNISTVGFNCFAHCSLLENDMKFSTSVTLGQQSFYACNSIKKYDFTHTLNIPTKQTDAFYNISKDCKIYVPFNTYLDWIDAWGEYINNIDGGETATITFSILPNTVNTIVRNKILTNTQLQWWGASCNYLCYEESNNSYKLYSGTLSDIEEGGTYSVNVNLNNYSTNLITIDIGADYCEVNLEINGKTFTAIQNPSDHTKYTFNLYSNSNETINYTVSHPFLTKPVTGSFTYNGSNITQTITLPEMGYYTSSDTVLPSASSDGSYYLNNYSSGNRDIEEWFDGDTTSYDDLRDRYLTTSYGAVREFSSSRAVCKVKYYPYSTNYSYNPYNWYIQGRNSTDEDWTLISSTKIHDGYNLSSNDPIDLIITDIAPYKMYRFLTSTTTSYTSNSIYVKELEFYEAVYKQINLAKTKIFNITTNVTDCTAFIINSDNHKFDLKTNGTDISGIVPINDNETVTLTISKSGYTTYNEVITGNSSINSYTKTITLEQLPFEVILEPGLTSYGWKESTRTNPKASDGWLMYESNNAGKDSTQSVMKVVIDGNICSNFICYIDSYAESNYDYAIISTLDAASYPTTYSSSTTYAHTRNNQKDPATFSNWTLVNFSNISAGQHYFYVVFVKDSSGKDYYDAGFLLINPNQ